MLQDCARLLSKLFSVCITDRTNSLESSKKWAVLFIVNLLFRIYFNLKNTRLCANIIRAIENPNEEFPSFDQFPTSERVTWYYFRSRIYISDSLFTDALSLLKLAYILIPEQWPDENSNASSGFVTGNRTNSFYKNKQTILIYLTAMMILVEGRLPKESLLTRFKLSHLYSKLCLSIRNVNLLQYSMELQKAQYTLIRLDLYFVFQVEIRQILYKYLFRLIYECYKSEGRLPIAIVALGFSLRDNVAWSCEKIECLAVSLISKSLMMGYIAHDKQIIVLSRKSPFP